MRAQFYFFFFSFASGARQSCRHHSEIWYCVTRPANTVYVFKIYKKIKSRYYQQSSRMMLRTVYMCLCVSLFIYKQFTRSSSGCNAPFWPFVIHCSFDSFSAVYMPAQFNSLISVYTSRFSLFSLAV